MKDCYVNFSQHVGGSRGQIDAKFVLTRKDPKSAKEQLPRTLESRLGPLQSGHLHNSQFVKLGDLHLEHLYSNELPDSVAILTDEGSSAKRWITNMIPK